MESGDQQGELSQPATIADPNRKKKDSASFLAELSQWEATDSLFTVAATPTSFSSL